MMLAEPSTAYIPVIPLLHHQVLRLWIYLCFSFADFYVAFCLYSVVTGTSIDIVNFTAIIEYIIITIVVLYQFNFALFNL